MTRTLLAVVCASALSGSAAAQAPGSAPQPVDPTPASAWIRQNAQPADSSRVVMTGCIDRADQLIQAGSTIGRTVDSLDLVLTHAELADSPPPTTPAPTGTSGADVAATRNNGIASMYMLEGQLSTLNPHVGHRVEITGTRVPSATGAKPPSASAVNPSAANAPVLKVESVKLISETCAR